MKSKIIICFSTLVLCACTTGAKLDQIQNYHESGQFEKLYATPSANNLDILIGADAAFQKNDYKQSDELYEELNSRNINPAGTSIGSEITKLAGGQMATEYKPYMMDFLFVSYYQIWDALAQNRFADARVIINQSYSRQQKMSDEYKSLLSDRQDSEKRDAITNAINADNSYWNAYSDIMNPALTYLSGIYFLNLGEYENARQYLVRANGMMPNNKYISDDLTAAKSGMTPENTAWIFIETGYAPRLREKRMDVPWVVGNNFQVISIATSYPEQYSDYTDLPDGAKVLADTDAMFMTEYKQYQINDGIRALAKAITNSIIQSNTADKMGGWGGLIGAAYSIATTNAEIRTWATLPQRIYLLRVKKDKSGLIKLSNGVNLNLEYSGNHIVYIRNNDIKTIKIK